MSKTLVDKGFQAEIVLSQAQRLAAHLRLAITTEAQADALIAAAENAYLSFGRDFNEATGMGCPSDWFQCPDGSCVGSEADCKGGNESAASLETGLGDVGGEA